jgi:hypothetical protein
MIQFPPRLVQILPKTIYFWLPVAIIFLGYGFLGRLWQIMLANGTSRLTLFMFLCLFIGSVWSLSMGLGGILATGLAIAIVFYRDGISSGLLAIGIAAIVIWLGFQETDPERNADQKLVWLDLVAVITIVALAFCSTIAIYSSVYDLATTIIIGSLAGAYTVIGAQIKSSGINKIEALQFFGGLALIGLIIGWLHGVFTYQVQLNI